MRNRTRELMTPGEQQEVLKILADSFEQKLGSLFHQKDSFDLCISVEYAFSEMAKNSQTDLSTMEPEFRKRMLRFKRTLQDLSKESAAQLIKGLNNLPADHSERHVYLNFWADGFLYLFRKQFTVNCRAGMGLGIGCFGELEKYPGNRLRLEWNEYLPLIQDLFLEHYSWDKFTNEQAAHGINTIFWMMSAMSPDEIKWLRAYFAPVNSADITVKQLNKAAETFKEFFEGVLRIKKTHPTFELPEPPSFSIGFQIKSDYLQHIIAWEKSHRNADLQATTSFFQSLEAETAETIDKNENPTRMIENITPPLSTGAQSKQLRLARIKFAGQFHDEYALAVAEKDKYGNAVIEQLLAVQAETEAAATTDVVLSNVQKQGDDEASSVISNEETDIGLDAAELWSDALEASAKSLSGSIASFFKTDVALSGRSRMDDVAVAAAVVVGADSDDNEKFDMCDEYATPSRQRLNSNGR